MKLNEKMWQDWMEYNKKTQLQIVIEEEMIIDKNDARMRELEKVIMPSSVVGWQNVGSDKFNVN